MRFTIAGGRVEFAPAKPCGECQHCCFAREVGRVLEGINTKMLPGAMTLAQDLAEARWRNASDREISRLSRVFERARRDWIEARDRVLNFEISRLLICEETGAAALPEQPEVPVPPEVTARQADPDFRRWREAQDAEFRLRISQAELLSLPNPFDPYVECIRCGAEVDPGSAEPQVCSRCFGKE